MINTASFFSTEEICYDLPSQTLHGLACGDDNNDIVLCLHGWLDNAASFLPVMPSLIGKRVIAIDWPGHGFSDHRSDDAYYHFVDWVYDLVQLFELNQWQNIDILAHSMGGMVASAFAAAFPEKVKSLTLIDSIGFLNSKAEQTTEQLRDGMLSRLKGSSLARQNNRRKKNIHPTQASAINARVKVSDLQYEQAEIIVKRGLTKVGTAASAAICSESKGQGYVWRSDSRLRLTSPYRLTLKQAEQFIRDIKCPVLLVHGSKGMDMVTSGIKHFGPLFQNFTETELMGGHHVHMEQPEALAKLFLDFVDEGVAK